MFIMFTMILQSKAPSEASRCSNEGLFFLCLGATQLDPTPSNYDL